MPYREDKQDGVLALFDGVSARVSTHADGIAMT